MSAPSLTQHTTTLRFLDPADGTPLGCVATWPDHRFTLTDVVDVLRRFGLHVSDHRPLGEPGTHHFTIAPSATAAPDPEVLELIADAFVAATEGRTEIDDFSMLVLQEGISWRWVDFVRAAVRFLAQAGIGLSPAYMLGCLTATPGFAADLAALFDARFRPGLPDRDGAVAATAAAVAGHIDRAATFDLDRTLRGLRSFVDATLRTNWFQSGSAKPYASFKLDPSALSVGGAVVPMREIYVHSPDVEGVHVRAELVARGGLRFSERPEDYRTEVLGLMATQAVKNAPIVPGGAKGAFVIRPGSGADLTTAYTTFVRGLLDVVDNIVDGLPVTPPDTVAYDGVDAYLVVAADKGTARMSDTANAVAAEYGYWLGDAFASGGSAGYDHKAMGITARGAWVAVRHRFAELGHDVDTQTFTVAGIGDMSGDVFGNGMLLSDRIRLVAAFDHRHIFLDPDPDPAASHRERARLFGLPRSSWADYDPAVISAGGGVWPRTAKSVPLSAPARAALGTDAEALTPDELIAAVLRAPVDLLWNGGVGTYVKASGETHGDAADPANDRVRVDARDVRARIVGEGGNLGFTRAARIEYARCGGRCDGDFIDNAAGVATSDREVNIKIAVDRAVTAGTLAPGHREKLLAAVTDDVAGAVLTASRDQVLALGCSEHDAPALLTQHERLIEDLARTGRIPRNDDSLPTADEIRERRRAGTGLLRPELAVLLAQSKNVVASELAASSLPDSPACAPWAENYFPAEIVARAGSGVAEHPLRREIVVASLADELVNRLGPGALYRFEERFGAATEDSARAYVVVSRVLHTEDIRARILADGADARSTVAELSALARVVEAEMAWLLRHTARRTLREVVAGTGDDADTPEALVALFAAPVAEALGERPSAEDCRGAFANAVVALRLGIDPTRVAVARDEVVELLHIRWLLDGFVTRVRGPYWEAMGAASLRDEIADRLDALVVTALDGGAADLPDRAHRLVRLLDRLRSEDAVDTARLAVIAGELRLLDR
ncbi:NAD-dependent glutamate dehydrogenase [Rhodococcus ruber BKS 20-38]|uniref:NAD-dependent glutamate dehydrogenase n=1 Tax=Rhodococcus ruber BKS 20-38 TaxID=1278076 RepID=M3A1K1_9NOCA|nr:NAD-glutamate dehydrogenase domain-containing protein [Rhodococcus ruber]EME66858.1 NAD-dependent glutamate dehydrogenase [Rhodococcus ruber BKS 20-38]